MSFLLGFIIVVAVLALLFYAFEQKRSSSLLSTLVKSQEDRLNGYFIRNTQLLSSLETSSTVVEKLRQELEDLKSQQQSKSVRLGLLTEAIVPLHIDFGVDYKTLVPMFRPIDYVSFEEDKITFIEVKMGSSQLSQKQKNIRRLVEEGRVYFKEVRVSETGLEVK